MKIKPDQLEHMRATIVAALNGKTLESYRDYLRLDPRVKDLEKRLRWELLYAARLGPWICNVLYREGCDESHIDTALRVVIAGIEAAP